MEVVEYSNTPGRASVYLPEEGESRTGTIEIVNPIQANRFFSGFEGRIVVTRVAAERRRSGTSWVQVRKRLRSPYVIRASSVTIYFSGKSQAGRGIPVARRRLPVPCVRGSNSS